MKGLKPHSSSQKSLEALNVEVKRLLKEVAAKLNTDQKSNEADHEMQEESSVEIKDEETRHWLLTLLSFHLEKRVDGATNLSVKLVNAQPTLLVENDPTSFRKCLVSIQKVYLEQVQQYAKEFFTRAHLKQMCQLVVQIVH